MSTHTAGAPTAASPGDRVTDPGQTRRTRLTALEALGLVVGLTVVVAIVFVAFALPGARTAPRGVPIGMAGPSPAVSQMAQGLAQAAPGAFAVTAYPDTDALRRAIRHRHVYGGFVLGAAAGVAGQSGQAGRSGQAQSGEGPGAPAILVATGGGPVVAQTLESVGQQFAARSGVQPRVEDLAALPPSDPRGLGLAGAALPISLGGLVPALLLIRRFPRRPGVRVVSAVAFSLLTGLTLAAILQWWFGSTSTGYWRVSLGLALGLAAISLAVLGLESLFGLAGFGIGAALIVLVGNPLSGLTSAPQFLPSGWGELGQLLPPGANATLLRSDAYFDGAGGGPAVLVLSSWVVLGLALVAVAAVRRRRAGA